MKKIKTMKSLVKYLIENNKKISAMESCTGGEIASTITNIEGASNVFEFSAVTYSNAVSYTHLTLPTILRV